MDADTTYKTNLSHAVMVEEWNTLMAHEHPRGAGPFVGHQLRYLVGSAHGWVGGVGSDCIAAGDLQDECR